MIQTNGEGLAFLCSTPRSGSTLLSMILESHSQVVCPNEPWFLLGLSSLYEGRNITYSRYEHSGVERALRDLLNEAQFQDCARAFALTAYNAHLESRGRTVFVDKTPRYFHILPFIDSLFPQAKKIWLQRNPLDVAASFVSSWGIPISKLLDPQYSSMSFDIPLGFFYLAEFFENKPNTLKIRYEELVTNPEPVIRSVCEYLKIEQQSGLDHYTADEEAIARRRQRTMGDKKVLTHDRPHTQSIDSWRNVLTHDDVQSVINILGVKLLERVGYGDLSAALLAEGYYFPAEQTVADNRSAFINSSNWLPWAHRSNP